MSLLRRLEYDAISDLEKIDGKILDLGGDRRSGYHELIKGNNTITVVNFNPECGADFCFDIEKPFSIDSNSYDAILCLNVLEHIYNYKNVVNEGFRVLKSGGKFIGVVPFLFHVHGSPDDYFRYTKSALERMFKDAGFDNIVVKELGTGVFSTLFQLTFGLYRPDVIKGIAMRFYLFLDKFCIQKIIKKVRPGNHLTEKHVPLGYFFIAEKE